MAAYSVTSWGRFLIVAAAAISVSGVYAPGSARADCGDYVTAGGKQTHRDMPSTSPRPCERCPTESPQPGRTPCRGPQCSGGEHPFPAPPTSQLDRAQVNWAHFCQGLLIHERNAGLLIWRLASLAPQSQPLSIFHPPRA